MARAGVLVIGRVKEAYSRFCKSWDQMGQRVELERRAGGLVQFGISQWWLEHIEQHGDIRVCLVGTTVEYAPGPHHNPREDWPVYSPSCERAEVVTGELFEVALTSNGTPVQLRRLSDGVMMNISHRDLKPVDTQISV